MEDQSRFNEKWDFRRKETSFDDSSSDENQNSKSIFNPKIVLDHDQPYHRSEPEAVATDTVITKRSAKARKRTMKKDENEAKKPKQVRRGRPKKNKEDNVMMNNIGKYMDTLLDDLKTSRESLLEWFKIEMLGSYQNIASNQPFLKRKTVEETIRKRSVKKRKCEKETDDQDRPIEKCLEIAQNGQDQNEKCLEITQNSQDQGEKYLEIVQNGQDQFEKCLAIAENGQNQVLELDGNVEPLETFSKNGQSGLGINYFHQYHQQQGGQDQVEKCLEIAQNDQNQVQVQELDSNVEPLQTFCKSGQSGLGIHYFHRHHQQHQRQQQKQQQKRQKSVVGSQTDKQMAKSAKSKNPKSIVLAIKAQNLGKGQKKSEAKTITNNKSSSTNLVSQSETSKNQNFMPKDHNFMIPFTPKLSSSSSSSFQSFPVSSSLNSMLPSSASQGIASLASNNNFQMRPMPQIPADLSEFQTSQGFVGNYSGYFPAAFQSNLITGLNFPVQVNPGNISQQNMFPGLRMEGGTIRFSGNFLPGYLPEAGVSNGNNDFSDYRAGSGSR